MAWRLTRSIIHASAAFARLRVLRTQICFPRRCGGCSGAITRILTKVDGIDKVEPDLETQKVTIEVAEGSSVDGEAILQKLNGCGPRPISSYSPRRWR